MNKNEQITPQEQAELEIVLTLLRNGNMPIFQDIAEIAKYLGNSIFRNRQDVGAVHLGVSDIQLQILREVAKTFELLGANSGIMAMVGSWSDTLPQEDILDMWRDWNKRVEEEGWIAQPAVFRTEPLHQ